MNKKLLGLVLGAMILTIVALVVSYEPKEALGEVAVGTATQSTSTPFLANNTVLCPSQGTLDSVIQSGVRTGQFWVINASSTTHTDFATTTALLGILDAGMGTSTTKYGVEANRGLVVSYTGTGTTTITYRCGS